MNHDDALLDRFLLGRTSPEETDALELRLLEDPALFESAQATEFELLERYSRGELDATDRLALSAHLQASPRLRESLAFSKALNEIARQNPAPRKGRLASFLASLSSPAARPAWAAAVLASIGAVWLGSQNLDLRQELATVGGIEAKFSELERQNQAALVELADVRERARLSAESEARFRAEYAQRQQRSSERETRHRKLATVSLTATTRSGTTDAPLALAKDATHVQIELDLPATGNAQPWTATVRRSGVTVWTENNLVVERSTLGVIGILEIPRQSLAAGRYEIEVRSATGPVATFPLTVERP